MFLLAEGAPSVNSAPFWLQAVAIVIVLAYQIHNNRRTKGVELQVGQVNRAVNHRDPSQLTMVEMVADLHSKQKEQDARADEYTKRLDELAKDLKKVIERGEGADKRLEEFAEILEKFREWQASYDESPWRDGGGVATWLKEYKAVVDKMFEAHEMNTKEHQAIMAVLESVRTQSCGRKGCPGAEAKPGTPPPDNHPAKKP